MSSELFFTACSRDTQDTFNRNSLHLLHCNAAHHLVDMTMGVDNDDEGSDADSVPSDRAVQNENELFTIYRNRRELPCVYTKQRFAPI